MIKKIANILYYFVFVTLTLVAGIVFLSTVKSNFPLKFWTVASGSMRPAIYPGSIVVARRQEKYEVGDVVTFRNKEKQSQTITHRITGVEYLEDGKSLFYTKGDGNEDEDSERLENEYIIGKVVLTVPFIGYLVSVCKTPFGLISLIFIPAIIFIVSEVMTIQKEVVILRKKSAKKQRRAMI